MGRVSKSGLILAGFAVLGVMAEAAHAQYRLEFSYCDRLQAQYLGAVERAGGSRTSGRSMVQIDQLSRQLAQAQNAARAYQCTGGFFIFGPRPSPQCPAIMAQVNRLSRQLSQLRGNDNFGFFGSSPQYEADRLRQALAESGCGVPSAGGNRTLCVRTCDGYYFPIEFSASRNRFDTDAAVCQSMYTQDGQAELFVQSNSGEVADAQSLSGRRYGDQPYAFLYRETYAPACVTQLQEGVAALGQRYLSRIPAKRKPAAIASAQAPVPMPLLRLPPSEDPETAVNTAGGFKIEPVAPKPAVAMSEAPAKSVRMVGAAYYADLFDLSKARAKQESLRPSFNLVGPAEAAETPAATPVTSTPAD